jgi:hypothetical protein
VSQSPPSPTPGAPDFDAVWRVADTVPGWLTEDQGRLLFDAAAALPDGATILEIGSHQGRSTVVLAEVAKASGGTVVAVDPFVDGRLFGGASTEAKLVGNLETRGLRDSVELVRDYSTSLRPRWDRPFDLLYVDGKHDYWTLSDDLKWSVHLPPGGLVLVHDCFSSIGVTLGILAHVLPGRELTYLSRAGSLAVFRRARPTWRDRARILAEMPWWVRNVALKVLLRLRLRPVARLLGHDSPYDPY